MDQNYIVIEHLHYTYGIDTDRPVTALNDINLSIGHSEYIAIMGHNGSGKSTLARCLNGLLTPTEGSVHIDGLSTVEQDSLFDIRRRIGMVFQHPDNQFVSTIVEHEVAFGPENLGIPREELSKRVADALEQTGLLELSKADPRTLSAGQKARLAIADMLAMQPEYLILDESTILLDPLSRKSIHYLLTTLNSSGMGIIHITHKIEEAIPAHRVIVMQHGTVAVDAPPTVAFEQADKLHLGIGQPPAMAIASGLRKRGLQIGPVITSSDLIDELGLTETKR